MVTTEYRELLDTIGRLAKGMNLERFIICAKEALVADRLNEVWGTDYEPSRNSALEGVDLISRSGSAPPVQVKSCVGRSHNQSAGSCRGDIVEKARAVDRSALIALVRFSGGTIDALFVGETDLVQDLDKQHISFPMVKRWGFEDLTPHAT
jgi:hypothetical protein